MNMFEWKIVFALKKVGEAKNVVSRREAPVCLLQSKIPLPG